MITDTEELRPKFNELIDIILKMCHQIYKRRPTCAEMLSEYSKWGIDYIELKQPSQFEENNELVKTNKLFDNYLKSKLNV